MRTQLDCCVNETNKLQARHTDHAIGHSCSRLQGSRLVHPVAHLSHVVSDLFHERQSLQHVGWLNTKTKLIGKADFLIKTPISNIIFNKSVQSNLGRGPRRDAVGHVRCPRPKFAPKSTPSRGPIHKPHYLPHPWTRPSPTYDAKRLPDPIRHFCTMHWTDRPTDRSFTAKFDDYSPLRL